MMRKIWSAQLAVILIGLCRTLPFSYAQSGAIQKLAAVPAVSQSSGSALLTQRAVEITKTSMQVIKEEDGVVTLTLYGNHSLVNKALVVFFRRKGSRVEVIANGAVSGEKKDAATGIPQIVVELDRDTVIKYPQKGDYAVPMYDPNATANGDKKDQFNFLVPEEVEVKEESDRRGYLEAGMGIMQGTLTTAATSTVPGNTMVNGAKKTTAYRFRDIHFAYYSDFLPVGIEMDSHSGDFPTQTYYRKVVKSSESVSNLSFNYRFKTLFHQHLAPVLKVMTLSDQFTTDNTDENLLSTRISGTGFGLRLNYDLASPIWKPEKGDFPIKFQNIYGEFVYYPSLTATDSGVSRGTTSPGSSGMQYRLGVNVLTYISFIPLFKRFIFQASYGARQYNLKFAGDTISEVGNANRIQPNGTSKEQEQDYRFFFGVRLDDPIRMLFSNDEKKEKK